MRKFAISAQNQPLAMQAPRKKNKDHKNEKMCKSRVELRFVSKNVTPAYLRHSIRLEKGSSGSLVVNLRFEVLRVTGSRVVYKRPTRPQGHSPLIRGRQIKLLILSPLLTKEGI